MEYHGLVVTGNGHRSYRSPGCIALTLFSHVKRVRVINTHPFYVHQTTKFIPDGKPLVIQGQLDYYLD